MCVCIYIYTVYIYIYIYIYIYKETFWVWDVKVHLQITLEKKKGEKFVFNVILYDISTALSGERLVTDILLDPVCLTTDFVGLSDIAFCVPSCENYHTVYYYNIALALVCDP